jgi:hypothetical protein
VVAERQRGLPGDQPGHGCRGELPLLQRWLRQLRGRLVRVQRDVPDREDPLLPLDAQVLADQDPPALALRQPPLRDGLGRGDPGGPHGQVALQLLPVGQDHAGRADLADRGAEPDVHAAGDELAPGVLAQPLVERHQQRGCHLDQPDVHPGWVDVREGAAQHHPAQFAEGPRQLDPGCAAADHGDRELARALVLAGTVLAGTVLAGTVLAGTVLAGTVLADTAGAQPLEAGHDVVAQHDRVGPGVEAERVLRRALHAEVRR